MKRHIRYLTLAALGAAFALQAGAVWAGGISFGGNRGGGGGGVSNLRSGSPVSGNFKPANRQVSSVNNFKAQPKVSLGGNSAPVTKLQNVNRVPSNGSQLLSQGGITGVQAKVRPATNVMKQAGGPIGGNNVPAVPNNVLTGNVKSHLIGQGTGANPRQILGGVNKPAGGVGIKIGGPNGAPVAGPQGGPKGGIAGGKLGGPAGNIVNKLGGGPAPHKVGGGLGITIGNKPGPHHDKFCGTPWPGHPHKGKADCHHVINLLVQHCMAKNHYEPCVKRYCPPQYFVETGWIPPPPVAIALPGQPAPGDLELVDVAMIADAAGELGPLYQVTIRNSGEITAEQFRVSAVAVLGEITEDSPSVTVNVERLAPGEVATLQIQLPGAVLAMGPEGETAVPFDTLVVAVDSFDELVEGNELNNVATLKRADIALVQVEVVAETTVAAAPVQGQVAPPAAVESAPAEGEAAEELPPADSQGPAPTEAPGSTGEIDIDSLDLGENDTVATQIE